MQDLLLLCDLRSGFRMPIYRKKLASDFIHLLPFSLSPVLRFHCNLCFRSDNKALRNPPSAKNNTHKNKDIIKTRLQLIWSCSKCNVTQMKIPRELETERGKKISHFQSSGLQPTPQLTWVIHQTTTKKASPIPDAAVSCPSLSLSPALWIEPHEETWDTNFLKRPSFRMSRLEIFPVCG